MGKKNTFEIVLHFWGSRFPVSPNFCHPAWTWEEEVSLEDIEFPLTIKVCVIPGFNQTALHEEGYADTYNYFLGNSRWENDPLGWGGHNEDSETFGNVEETLAKVSYNNFESIFDDVDVWTKDEESIDIPLLT